MGTKPSVFQPHPVTGHQTPQDHSGKVLSHVSHAFGADVPARHGGTPNLARDASRGRHVEAVAIHGGMTARQTALKGMQHATATAPDANPASPLTKEPQGKVLKPVQPVPGQRSRLHDVEGAPAGFNHRQNCGKGADCDARALGSAILTEALVHSGVTTRRAHGSGE